MTEPTCRRRPRSHCPLQPRGGPHRLHIIRATGATRISPKAQKKFGSCEARTVEEEYRNRRCVFTTTRHAAFAAEVAQEELA